MNLAVLAYMSADAGVLILIGKLRMYIYIIFAFLPITNGRPTSPAFHKRPLLYFQAIT